MKKLNTLFVLLAMSVGVFAQSGPFTIIGWVNLAADGAYNFNFNDNPFTKGTVEAMKTKSAYVIDMAAIDEIQIQEIWDQLGDPYLIANKTGGTAAPVDLDANAEGTFGSAFKAIYDDENLYVLFKYVDTERIAGDGTTDKPDTREFEIAFQTRDIDRYEAGYLAAAGTVYGPNGQNAQYGRYIELGGGKAVFSGEAGISATQASPGQGTGGAWVSSIGAANTPETFWTTTQDGTVWAIVAFNFQDYMTALIDEWGATEAANIVGLDPTETSTITFDVKQNATVNTDDVIKYWWNGTDDNVYCLNYFAGYLHFSDEEWVPLGTNDILKAAPKSAFIYDNILKFKGYDSPVNVDIYSVVGQKVKSAKNVNTLSVADLTNGVYVIKVGNDVFKVLK